MTNRELLIKAALNHRNQENCDAIMIPLDEDIWIALGTKEHIRDLVKDEKLESECFHDWRHKGNQDWECIKCNEKCLAETSKFLRVYGKQP